MGVCCSKCKCCIFCLRYCCCCCPCACCKVKDEEKPVEFDDLSKVAQENKGFEKNEDTNSFKANGAKKKGRSKKLPEPPVEQETIEDDQEDEEILIALYDYNARVDGDLKFKKGDKLRLVDKGDGDWWKATHMKTKQSGYIPSNYVALYDSVMAFDWYHGLMSRKDAERYLKAKPFPRGTFLIRESENIPGYALSVIDIQDDDLKPKHYRINKMDNGKIYLSSKLKFDNLKELVDRYSKDGIGICYKLTMPCPKEIPITFQLSHATKEQWEISRKSLKLGKKLGAGKFGEVHKAKWNGHLDVAVKSLKPGTMTREAFLREAEVMMQFRHIRLVQLYAACTKEEPLYIVTEYVENGCLLDYLRDDKNKLDEAAFVDIAAQVASGMAYIEKKKYIHRDLAARNVLVGQNKTIKIADFGLSRAIEDEIYEADPQGMVPYKWTALEGIQMQVFTIKSDVWSYGILLVEIFSKGMIPYPGMANKEVVEKIKQGYRHPAPKGCPTLIYREMEKCWDEDPDCRPTFSSIYDFLSSNEWKEGTYMEAENF